MSWKTVSIGEITKVVTKGTTPKVFLDSGVNYIKAEALNGDSSLNSKRFYFIDEQTHESLRRSQLDDGDVLLTIAGAQIGKCGYVKDSYLPANTNQAVGIMRLDKNKAIPKFIYYFFKQKKIFQLIQGLNSQAAQPNINLTMLKQIKLQIPKHSIQQKITSTLSTYDDLIENNRRRIQLLEESARLLYKEWFVNFRFPGHENIRIVDGVPEGWKTGCASDILDVMSGGTPKTKVSDYWDGEIPFFTPKDATDTPYVLSTEKTLSEEGLKKCNSKFYPKNTIFITARGTVGKLNLAQKSMAMNQSCYALKAKAPLNQLFLYSALEASIAQFKSRASGAVFDAIVVDTFKFIQLITPPKILISKFTEIAEPIFTQIEILLIQNQKLAKARDLLLPRLMTGEVEV